MNSVGFCLLVSHSMKGLIARTNFMERALSMKSCLAKSSNIDVVSTKFRCNKGSASTWAVTGCVGLGSKRVRMFHVAIFKNIGVLLCFRPQWGMP